MEIKFRHSVFCLLYFLSVAASAAAGEEQPLTAPSPAAPDLAADLYLLPDNPARQEVVLPFSGEAGTLSIGAYNEGKEGDAPFEKAGVSLAGTTATENFNLNGTLDLSHGKTALSVAIQPKEKPATLGLLYLYDQADKTKSRNRTPLMILPRIGSSLLLPDPSGGEVIKTVGLYADYSLSKDMGIHWAMGYADVNDQRVDLDKKAWEYNVGLAYNFFNNFMYEAHFGYLTTDDGTAHAVEPQVAPVEEVYMVTNNISMKF